MDPMAAPPPEAKDEPDKDAQRDPVIASWQARINLRGNEQDKGNIPTNTQLEGYLVDHMVDYLDDNNFSDNADVTVTLERLDK